MDAVGFAEMFNVSRETSHLLERYIFLLKQWNNRINLVSPSTIDDVWSRHIADSAQLLSLAPPTAQTWLDLGSGAGLPGIPVAIVARETAPSLRVSLVESDRRKVAFLQTVKREVALDVVIEGKRIEALPLRPYDVISARALASLDRLCALASPFRGGRTTLLFHKGESVDSELTEASRNWHIRADRIPSRTNPDAAILRITDLEPRT